jgi:hypothetical protein
METLLSPVPWVSWVTTHALEDFNTLPTLDVGDVWIWTPYGLVSRVPASRDHHAGYLEYTDTK